LFEEILAGIVACTLYPVNVYNWSTSCFTGKLNYNVPVGWW